MPSQVPESGPFDKLRAGSGAPGDGIQWYPTLGAKNKGAPRVGHPVLIQEQAVKELENACRLGCYMGNWIVCCSPMYETTLSGLLVTSTPVPWLFPTTTTWKLRFVSIPGNSPFRTPMVSWCLASFQ